MEEQKQIPILRFPEFSEPWKNTYLGKVCELTSSKRVYLTDYVESGIPFFRGKEITELKQNITPKDILYISEAAYEGYKIKYGVPLKNDLLITAVGTLGNVYRVPDDSKFYFKDGNLIWLRKIKDDSRFIEFLLEYNKSAILKASIGSTQKALTIVELRKTELTIPSVAEQYKIVSFLTAVDVKIQQLTKKKALLEKYKRGVMQQIFNQEIRFKDDYNDYPDWEEKELREISNRITSKNRNGEVKLVLTNSATRGIVNQKDYFENDVANHNNLFNYYLVDTDSFIYNPRISNSAPVGPIKRNKLPLGVMSPLYTVFRFSAGNLSFYEYYFETNLWHGYMKSIANYGARHDRMSITSADFLRLPLPFPCLKEQTKIANFLSAIDDKINYVTKQLEQTKLYKKGLLQQMFV